MAPHPSPHPHRIPLDAPSITAEKPSGNRLTPLQDCRLPASHPERLGSHPAEARHGPAPWVGSFFQPEQVGFEKLRELPHSRHHR